MSYRKPEDFIGNTESYAHKVTTRKEALVLSSPSCAGSVVGR